MNYLLLNGTMTLKNALVACAGDVLSAEDINESGVGLKRAVEELGVVEETEMPRLVLAEQDPDAAIAKANNLPITQDDDGLVPGAVVQPRRRKKDMPGGKTPKQVERANS